MTDLVSVKLRWHLHESIGHGARRKQSGLTRRAPYAYWGVIRKAENLQRTHRWEGRTNRSWNILFVSSVVTWSEVKQPTVYKQEINSNNKNMYNKLLWLASQVKNLTVLWTFHSSSNNPLMKNHLSKNGTLSSHFLPVSASFVFTDNGKRLCTFITITIIIILCLA